MKWNKIIGFSFFVSLSCISHADKLKLTLSGGPSFSSLSNEELVQINSFVTNQYHSNHNTDWKGFWGVGLAHTFEKQWFSSYQLSLGVTAYSIHLGQVAGVESPFINGGSFDTLNYQFDAKSSTGMLESRLINTHYNWQPFLLLGIGASWNRLYNYSEVPSDPTSSASPVWPGYQDHTEQQFAYELGIGVQHQLWKDTLRNIQYNGIIGYRYFSLGRGELGRFPAQTSSDRLRINNLSTQGIVFALDVSLN